MRMRMLLNEILDLFDEYIYRDNRVFEKCGFSIVITFKRGKKHE